MPEPTATQPPPPNRRAKSARTVAFGWQGVRGRVPPDWNLGAIGGGRKSGYVRLDDETMPRLELKWQQPEGTIDLDKILDTYLRDVRKRTRRRKADFTVTRGVKLLSRRQKRNKELRGYTFAGDHQAQGMIWHCHTCGRVLISQVLGPEGVDLTDLATAVLGSLEDHTRDHWDLWAAYGMQFRLPDDFDLESQRLMTGQLELSFLRHKREKVTVARWALANVLLKRSTLPEWAAKTYPPRHPEFRLVYRDEETRGHSGIDIRAEAPKIRRLLQEAARTHVLRQTTPQLHCRLWHCERENKLFAVDSELLPEQQPVLDYVIQSLDCH